MNDTDTPADNRAKKVAGRDKRRKYVQGTRAYTHAVLNSIDRRAREKGARTPTDSEDKL